MDRGQTDDALPQAVARRFVAQHEGELALPVDKRAARDRIGLRHETAVHVNRAAVDRVVGRNDVLQGGLQDLVHGRRRQRRIAIQAGLGSAELEIVVIQCLLQREIALRRARRITDDAGFFLRDVGRHDPGFDRELARFLDDVEQLG